MRHISLIATLLATLASNSIAETHGEQDSLTIYSKLTPGQVRSDLYRAGNHSYNQSHYNIPGYAIVRHKRQLPLEAPRGELRFSDVTALIDPTTVQFKSLTHPNTTRVIEQNYHYDLVSQQKLLERYLGQTLTIGTIKGELLSFSENKLLLKDDKGQVHQTDYPTVYPSLPGGLMTKPTLIWDIEAANAGKHTVEVAYQTEGMTWWSDYNVVFRPGETANQGVIDVGAWVSIINQTGADFKSANLKLVAGDVQKIQPQMQRVKMTMAEDALAAPGRGAAGFSEKAFFEYHLYTLGRTTDLPNRSTKQIELFATAQDIPVDKELVYVGQLGSFYSYGFYPDESRYNPSSNKKVHVYLNFKNSTDNKLGIPMPAGRIRVSQQDTADGNLEFIGEDIIDHTPKDEEISIKLGSAFDIVGERKQTDFKTGFLTENKKQRWLEETFEIELRNHKDEDVTVMVKEYMSRWRNWIVVEASHNYEKLNSSTVQFPMSVKAHEKATVQYRVRYTWEVE